MDRSTVVTLLVVVGLVGVAWWYFNRGASETVGAQQPTSACGSGIMGSIGSFIEGHVDRKNAIAPLVASAYAKAPPDKLQGITNLAGQLSPSSYLENKIAKPVGEWLCKVSLPSVGSIANAAVNVLKTQTTSAATFGTSQLKAGTITPVKSLGSAASNLVHGNFGDAAHDVANSVTAGPVAAYNATKSVLSSINPF